MTGYASPMRSVDRISPQHSVRALAAVFARRNAYLEKSIRFESKAVRKRRVFPRAANLHALQGTIKRAALNMRSKRCFTFVHIRAPVTPGSTRGPVKQCPPAAGFLLLDTGSVTPDLIRGRYDGADAQPRALISKLIDNLERLFREKCPQR